MLLGGRKWPLMWTNLAIPDASYKYGQKDRQVQAIRAQAGQIMNIIIKCLKTLLNQPRLKIVMAEAEEIETRGGVVSWLSLTRTGARFVAGLQL